VRRKELRRKSSKSGDKANIHARTCNFCWGMELDGRGRAYMDMDICIAKRMSPSFVSKSLMENYFIRLLTHFLQFDSNYFESIRFNYIQFSLGFNGWSPLGKQNDHVSVITSHSYTRLDISTRQNDADHQAQD
jgi:hypothetical protein